MGTIRILDKSELSIKDTLECGQVFRFKKTNDGYEIYSLDKKAFVKDSDDGAIILSDDAEYFGHYFDLYRDYRLIKQKLGNFDELKDAAKCGGGIRLLRQDPFESLISFIISANNNIPRIKTIIENICALCGKKMDGYYAFPTRAELLKVTIEDLKKCGVGYRAEYIKEAANVADEEFITNLKKIKSSDAYKKLLTIKGIGPKVANCIMLFGLARWDSFPVDTWMFKTLKNEELDTKEKVHDYYLNRYGSFSGLAQQYIFHYNRNIKKDK